MAKRLIKIAKELNVGTTTIVDYLNNSGFDIDNKPTAQVTDEMYTELLKEFQKSIAIKEKADQLIIGNRPAAKKDTASIVAEPVTAKTAPAETTAEERAQKETKSSEQAQKEKTPPKERKGILKSRLKVLGKINLDGRGKNKPEPAAKPEPKRKAEPAPKPEPEPIQKSTPKPEAKVEQKSKSADKPEPAQKSEADTKPVQQPKPEPKKETAEPQEKVQPKDQETKPELKVEEKEKEKPTPAPSVKAEQAAPQTLDKTPEPAQMTPPEITKEIQSKEKDDPAQPDPDSETIQEKPKQAQNIVKETEDPSVASAPVVEGTNKEKVVRAEAPELRGLKILGKIDTAKFKRPKKKKKEKSTDKSRARGGQGQAGSGKTGSEKAGEGKTDKGKGTEDGRKGKKEGTTDSSDSNRRKRRRTRRRVPVGDQQRSSSGGGNSRNDNRRRGSRRVIKKRDESTEVSQKEIEEKIKATMARIAGGGKKKRQRMRRDNRDRLRERQELREQEQTTDKLQLTEFVSVQELANLMDVNVTDVIMTCMNLGVIVSINQRLDAEIIELVAEEYDHEVEFISAEELTEEEEEIVDDPEDLEPRAPIVTVMGHVDHGKTSLLDYIREANVVEGEAGGITQHIGAYEVAVGEEKRRITFLDTPGHEAFTAMRARGAKVTDIAVIIIAADDSIMPQTREAISHAQAAGVPMVFAINKVDKAGADPNRIKQELASMNFLVEEWGGKYQSQDISAKLGTGIDELLEKILLEAEFLELKANPKRAAIGAIIEASLDKGRGYVSKVLIQTGTLHIGDPIIAGEHSGKVKAMFNERGKRVKEAGPSKPVLVLGLDGAPQAGERFKEADSEQEARQVASKRAQIVREQANRATKRISLDEIGRRLALGSFKELNLIVKGDVDGSIEALADSLIKLSIESVQVNVIHKAVGQIIESDVLLASASDAIIIGFQVRPSLGARKLAEKEGVQIKMYSIIYKAIEEIKMAIEGMLEPTKEEKIVAQLEVREVYKISRVGTIAGCYVQEGKITRNTSIRLIRDGIVIYPTKEGAIAEVSSLKRFKDDVREVKAGLECGLGIKNYNDIKVGDVVEGYEIIEVKQRIS